RLFMAVLREQPVKWFIAEYAGRNLQVIKHRTLLVCNVALADFDTWLHYVKGNFDLVGPAPLKFNISRLSPQTRQRLQVSPGIIHPYAVKRASGIAHKTEAEVSHDFACEATAGRRIQLLCTHLLQRALGTGKVTLSQPRLFNLFGVQLANVSMQGAIDNIISALGERDGRQHHYAFVNADCANQYYGDDQYKTLLNNCEHVFADGIGVKIAARWQGVELAENVNGTDMFPLLCERLQETGDRLYLLGAEQSVLEKLVKNLHSAYPSLNIGGYCDGFSHQDNPQQLIEKINRSHADLLLVAMGAPRQEHWIAANMPALNAKAAIGVGGLFDFYSGEVSRAPQWLRELSMEWVWRLLMQPLDKGKRYLIGNPLFLFRAFTASRRADAAAKNANEVTYDYV
ncbi:MAG: WecB/TagA/CpsF family glycosyltransferase, partial [Gammaproteobacteria bacterium]|nr:WecB/TagA/CpsF family glycosyltransferase [Gammaproteobacteria bacterium]